MGNRNYRSDPVFIKIIMAMTKKLYIYNKLFIPLMVVAAMFTSCAKEKHHSDLPGGVPVQFDITLPALRSIVWEKENDGIDDIRLIILTSSDGKIIYNEKLLLSDFDLDETNPGIYGTYPLELFPGMYDFLMVANEKEKYETRLKDAKNKNDLKAIKITELNIANNDMYGDWPAGEIIYEENVLPLTRAKYLSHVLIGNNMTSEKDKQISLDGVTWVKDLPVSLERIAARMNISLRKMTGVYDSEGHEKDRFFVSSLRLLHVPNYAYMIPYNFDGNRFCTLNWYEWIPDPSKDNDGREDNDYLFLNNNGNISNDPGSPDYDSNLPDTFTIGGRIYVASNRRDIILPEYLMANPLREEDAVVLEIRGDYQSWNKDKQEYNEAFANVWGFVPVATGAAGGNKTFDIKRNHDYHLLVSITQVNNFNFVPEITVIETEWSQDNEGSINIGGNGEITLDNGRWTHGNADAEGDVAVSAGNYVEYTFTFGRPAGDVSIIKWKAALTNPVDFRVDGSYSGGYAVPGETVAVRVYSQGSVQERVSSKLYINIDDGQGGTIKLPLNAADSYTIIQNP